MPPASERLVRYEVPVTFQTLVESRSRAAELIVPVRCVPFRRVAAIELDESLMRSPVSVSPSAVKMAVPPLEPVVPQLPALALIRTPPLAVIVTPLRVITPVELVT